MNDKLSLSLWMDMHTTNGPQLATACRLRRLFALPFRVEAASRQVCTSMVVQQACEELCGAAAALHELGTHA